MIMRSSSRKTGGIFTMLILLLFSVCSLLLILIGYHVYQKIDANMEGNSEIRSSFYYLSNKIRSNLSDGSIELVDAEGVKVLSLNQSADGLELYSYIYFYDGAVREQLVTDSSGFDPAYGEIIMEADGFTITSRNDGLLDLTVETRENQDMTMKIRMDA